MELAAGHGVVPVVKIIGVVEVQPAFMAAGLAQGLAGILARLAARLAPFDLDAQGAVKGPRGNETLHAEAGAGIRQGAQDGQVRGQLELESVVEPHGIGLAVAGFVVNHGGERAVAVGQAAHIDAVDDPPQGQGDAFFKRPFEAGERVLARAEPFLGHGGIEAVPAHPFEDDTQPLAKAVEHAAGGKGIGRVGAHEAEVELPGHGGARLLEAAQGVVLGEIAPAQALAGEGFVKAAQDGVLVAAGLAGLELEPGALDGAQAGLHEELERARRVALQGGDGQLHARAVEAARGVGRERGIGRVAREGFERLAEGLKGCGPGQCFTAPARLAHAGNPRGGHFADMDHILERDHELGLGPFDLRRDLLQAAQERRRQKDAPLLVLAGKGKVKALARTGERDVAEVALAADLPAGVRA